VTHPPQQSIYGEDARAEVAPFIPSGAHVVLDVGCGPGGFGLTLRERLGSGTTILGIDAVEDNVSAARVDHGFDEVLVGFFPDVIQDRPEQLDLITFLDVLEHMVDPWAALQSAHTLLEPGGRVVAAIPNIRVFTLIRDLLKGRWDYTDTGTLDRTHVRFFTRATMIEMFEQAGFVVEECSGINSQRPRRPIRGYLNRRMFVDMKWLLFLVPDSEWLQFVIVARKP